MAKAKHDTRGKLRQKLAEIDKAIARYLGDLGRADEVFEQTGAVLPEARMERSLRTLGHLQKEAVRYRSVEHRMDETGKTQVSLTDPDARAMATTADEVRTTDQLTAIADIGYYRDEEIVASEGPASPLSSRSL